MGVTLGALQQSLVKIALFANSSHMIGPKRLKYTEFSEGPPGVVTRKFGEDQSKAQPVGLFFPKNFLVVVQLYA